MTVRPVSTGSMSFGLVSIPVKLFSAIRRRTVNFNLLHAKDLSRIQQQIYCPLHNATISRSELVRGVQVEKGRYVTFSDEELKALEADNGQAIEITEFLPIAQVDPLYFEEAYYLGVDGNAAKAYRLLANAMAQAQRVALGRFTMHGKEHVVIIRPFRRGLMLHTIYYADEVRPTEEVDQAPHEQAREA
jgi:DNA end-binding protein Ku